MKRGQINEYCLDFWSSVPSTNSGRDQLFAEQSFGSHRALICFQGPQMPMTVASRTQYPRVRGIAYLFKVSKRFHPCHPQHWWGQQILCLGFCFSAQPPCFDGLHRQAPSWWKCLPWAVLEGHSHRQAPSWWKGLPVDHPGDLGCEDLAVAGVGPLLKQSLQLVLCSLPEADTF